MLIQWNLYIQSPYILTQIKLIGEKWVSDFVQRRFWPGTAYENDYKKRKEEKREVNFKIFRW